MSVIIRHLDLSGGRPISGDKFRAIAPRRSIAIDGYIPEATWFDAVGLHANFNHHEGSNRLATRCTAAQILLNIRMGGFSSFFDERAPVHVFYNDCDPDVIMSLWILENAARVQCVRNPIVNKMVHLLDMLDSTSATYPFPADLDLGTYEWVFDPYFDAQKCGVIDRKNPKDYELIIEECFARIERYLAGTPGRVAIDMTFDTIGLYKGWGMFHPHGSLSRMAIVGQGHFAFVLVRQRDCGRFVYVLQRTCEGVHFPLIKFYDVLNAVEGQFELWGGCDIIGGSPRVLGSRIPPEKLAEILNSVMAMSTTSASIGLI